jgi:hypothetical protein
VGADPSARRWLQDGGTAYLCVARPGFEVQALGLSYLTHRDPGGGHDGPAKAALQPAVKITRAFR